MSWFRRSRPSPESPEDQFADEVIALARDLLGLEATRIDGFALQVRKPDGGPVTMYLQNVYAEAQRLRGAERSARLRTAVLGMVTAERPETWEDAAPLLLPAVRSATWGLPVRSPVDGRAPLPSLFGKPLVPFVKIVCAIDSEHSMSFATEADLAAWGVSDEEAIRTAVANLAGQECEVRAGGPMAILDGPDGYTSSWLAAPEFLSRMAANVGDEVVAAAPSRDNLVLVNTRHHEAVADVLDMAFEEYQESPRRVSPVPYLVSATGVQPWEPPADHPSRPAVDKARRVLAATEYGAQKARLDDAEAGEPAHVAKYELMQRPDGVFEAWATCVRQVGDGLLPQADMLMFVDNDDTDSMFAVTWDDALRMAGHALHEEPGYDPPRWRYHSWPDDGTIAALRAMDAQPDSSS